ncbi:TRAP transporter substrate-binding protein [Oceanobacillus bengalensis]|uniref:TRAP transporter substrate-binding protein n=1 Tax=Oceanobacillus bengalensis TaxID=1435466 RepID=A0A494YWX2_9BACI|nr:TRAP transporter substrate-binding protein [Oceanobacillus bengalensis]RKQ14610.1 TRAP transporter substrate-binding protein [Oceanobacillus bengalensis]
MTKLRNTMIFLIAALSISIVVVFFTTNNAFSDDVTTIRFGHGSAETNERHIAVMHFKDLVEEKSDGQIEVLVYPNEQLGSESEMVESVTLNDLQMVAASAYSQYDQRISVFELPYLFDSYEQAWSVLDGEIGKEVSDIYLEDNLRIIAYFENGFRQITANKAIETPNDLSGLKIRTPEFPISISMFSALGANPTPMAFGELYMGLQQGTVDAQENPVANTYASKFNEVQDYLIMSNHQYMPLPVSISEDFWQSLTAEEQQIIEESALETAQFHRDLLRENEETMISELEAAGMGIIYPDTEPFKAKVDGVYDSFRENYGDDLLDKVLGAVE